MRTGLGLIQLAKTTQLGEGIIGGSLLLRKCAPTIYFIQSGTILRPVMWYYGRLHLNCPTAKKSVQSYDERRNVVVVVRMVNKVGQY